LLILTGSSIISCAADSSAYSGFQRRLAAGASCSELFEIRNDQDHASEVVERMNSDLRAIGCHSSGSVRSDAVSEDSATEPGQAAMEPSVPTFTVVEYRMYRTVIDAPMSVPEEQAVSALAERHAISSDSVQAIVRRVQEVLSRNNWYSTPESETRHASDWTTQRR
jgi:hypothetical protein